MRKKMAIILFSLLAAVGLLQAASYTLTQLKPDTVASFMASNDTFFVKSDWIGGCGGADPTYLALKKAIGDSSGIPFVVANWGDWKVFRTLETQDAGLNYFLRIGGKTHAWRGPRVYWSVYEWAYGILAGHNKTSGLPVQPRLRTAPDTAGSVNLEDGLANLYSFDNGSTESSVSGGSKFYALGWSRYKRDNTLDIYHEYMHTPGVTRPDRFTSGLNFRNKDMNFKKGFSVAFEFKPHTTKNEGRLLFQMGARPSIGIHQFKGVPYIGLETDRAAYGVIMPDLTVKTNQWNTVTFSYDPAAGRVRIFLNGNRLKDIVLPAGLSGNNIGEEAESVQKKYSEGIFSFIRARAGDMFSGQVDNLAFWTRPLSGAEINKANSWVRGRTGSGSAPLSSGSSGSSGDGNTGVVPPGEE